MTMLDMLVLVLLAAFLWGAKLRRDTDGDYLSAETCLSWRGVFAVIILLHHTVESTGGGLLFSRFEWLGYLSAGIFFFFSGFGVMTQYRRSSRYAEGFLRRRLPTVLLPYLVMAAVYALMFAVTGRGKTVGEILRALSHGETFVPNAWFILVILLQYVAFRLLTLLCGQRYGRIVVLSGVLYLLWAALCRALGFGDWWYISAHLFTLGLLWALYEEKLRSFFAKHRLAWLVGTFLLFLVFHRGAWRVQPYLPYEWMATLITLLTACFFTLSIVLLSMTLRFGNGLTRFLGKCSMEIYLSHAAFMLILRSRFISLQNDLLWVTGVLVCTAVFSCVLRRLLEPLLARIKRKT